MTDFVLKETSLRQTRQATEQLNGKNYKVYKGSTETGADLSVIIGQDRDYTGKSYSWHMSIASTEPLDFELVEEIIADYWPTDVSYRIETRPNFGRFYSHVFEKTTVALH